LIFVLIGMLISPTIDKKTLFNKIKNIIYEKNNA
jgi:hypothetical protein